MARYVVGIVFSEDLCDVLLMTKTKPEWQRGLLNGVGGKVEEGEQPVDAMVREFAEEVDLESVDASFSAERWRRFAVLRAAGGDEVLFYATRSDEIYGMKGRADEGVSVYVIEELEVVTNHHDVIYNIPWLIHMALDLFVNETHEYTITEGWTQ